VNTRSDVVSGQLRIARRRWSGLNRSRFEELRALLKRYEFSVALGEITNLNNSWYVSHSGLIQLAFRRRCGGIETAVEESLSDPAGNRWVFKATAYKSKGSKGFVGYGDADPSNVSSIVQGAELRIAETRAVNRALRKAYGIGICSVEELGASAASNRDPDPYRWASAPAKHSNNGQPRLRDQLCVLIRQHNLDPALVKAYAADYCGTATLAGASRDLVESFISHLSSTAKENRDSLVCKLNSYAQSVEARP
jgi:hypothetical protein